MRFEAKSITHQEYLALIDFIASYDIACAFEVNIVNRWREHFPELEALISRVRWLIPLLHIQNHIDNCTYLYSTAYVPEVGHFYGESAEHPWPYLNLFSGQGRQMSHGNRHDLYNDLYNYWNFRKLMALGS